MISKTEYLKRCEDAYDNYAKIEQTYPRQCAPERWYFRDISFSLWHRSLSQKCYTIDLDFIEMRNQTPTMLYDIKSGKFNIDTPRKDYLKTYKMVADAIDIPFCVVKHNDDMTRFEVYHIEDISPNLKYNKEVFNESEMRNFIESW